MSLASLIEKGGIGDEDSFYVTLISNFIVRKGDHELIRGEEKPSAGKREQTGIHEVPVTQDREGRSVTLPRDAPMETRWEDGGSGPRRTGRPATVGEIGEHLVKLREDTSCDGVAAVAWGYTSSSEDEGEDGGKKRDKGPLLREEPTPPGPDVKGKPLLLPPGVTANSRSEFVVPLKNTLHLSDEWEVGLAEIFIPEHRINFYDTDMSHSMVVYFPHVKLDETGQGNHSVETWGWRVGLPVGQYDPINFCEAFNRRVATLQEIVTTTEDEEGGGGKKRKRKVPMFQGQLKFKRRAHRFELTLGHGESLEVDDPRVAFMLGWKPQRLHIGPGKKRNKMTRYEFPYTCEFVVNGHQMMVYADIVEYSLVGNGFFPILRTVHLENEKPLTVQNRGTSSHVAYSNIQYHSLRSHRISMVEVKLSNTNGSPMVFGGISPTSLVLHFRRKPKYELKRALQG